jgi:hypothetical protein
MYTPSVDARYVILKNAIGRLEAWRQSTGQATSNTSGNHGGLVGAFPCVKKKMIILFDFFMINVYIQIEFN